MVHILVFIKYGAEVYQVSTLNILSEGQEV